MRNLKIEKGKLYRTRGGYRARIYHIYPNGIVHGAIQTIISQDSEYGWTPCEWSFMPLTNKWLTYVRGIDADAAELDGEWCDPAGPIVDWNRLPSWVNAIALGPHGIWEGFTHIPSGSLEKGLPQWECLTGACWGYGSLNSEDHPEFSGEWMNSLAVRPGYKEA